MQRRTKYIKSEHLSPRARPPSSSKRARSPPPLEENSSGAEEEETPKSKKQKQKKHPVHKNSSRDSPAKSSSKHLKQKTPSRKASRKDEEEEEQEEDAEQTESDAEDAEHMQSDNDELAPSDVDAAAEKEEEEDEDERPPTEEEMKRKAELKKAQLLLMEKRRKDRERERAARRKTKLEEEAAAAARRMRKRERRKCLRRGVMRAAGYLVSNFDVRSLQAYRLIKMFAPNGVRPAAREVVQQAVMHWLASEVLCPVIDDRVQLASHPKKHENEKDSAYLERCKKHADEVRMQTVQESHVMVGVRRALTKLHPLLADYTYPRILRTAQTQYAQKQECQRRRQLPAMKAKKVFDETYRHLLEIREQNESSSFNALSRNQQDALRNKLKEAERDYTLLAYAKSCKNLRNAKSALSNALLEKEQLPSVCDKVRAHQEEEEEHLAYLHSVDPLDGYKTAKEAYIELLKCKADMRKYPSDENKARVKAAKSGLADVKRQESNYQSRLRMARNAIARCARKLASKKERFEELEKKIGRNTARINKYEEEQRQHRSIADKYNFALRDAPQSARGEGEGEEEEEMDEDDMEVD